MKKKITETVIKDALRAPTNQETEQGLCLFTATTNEDLVLIYGFNLVHGHVTHYHVPDQSWTFSQRLCCDLIKLWMAF